ncbi:hypothetical protein AVEN_265959-1, partial [Araneus ventricosus]
KITGYVRVSAARGKKKSDTIRHQPERPSFSRKG